MNKMIEVGVHGVYRPEGESPDDATIVILKAREQVRYLPICIGFAEGQSIFLNLQGIKPSRPLSHDFMAQLVEQLGGRIEAVNITHQNTTFYATTKVVANNTVKEIDCRPSDALALAVRVEAPIFVAVDVLEQAGLDEAKGTNGKPIQPFKLEK